MNWHQLSTIAKQELVASLQQMRLLLIKQARQKRAAKSTRRKKPKTMTFASRELEELFNSMPPEFQRSLTG